MSSISSKPLSRRIIIEYDGKTIRSTTDFDPLESLGLLCIVQRGIIDQTKKPVDTEPEKQ